MPKKKGTPERVKLRDETQCDVGQWLGLVWGLGKESGYTYTPDPELETIMGKASGDGLTALRLWYGTVKPRLLNARGVHLIPGPIQDVVGLPLRQIYIDKDIDAICRVEPEPDRRHGRVMARLI